MANHDRLWKNASAMTYGSQMFYYIVVVQAQHKRVRYGVPESYPRSVRVVGCYNRGMGSGVRWVVRRASTIKHGKNNLDIFYRVMISGLSAPGTRYQGRSPPGDVSRPDSKEGRCRLTGNSE